MSASLTSFNILAFETSTERLSVALAIDGRVRVEHFADAPHSERILHVVRTLLDSAGATTTALHGVAFGAGPGAFTGVRLGCGVAQGIALAHDLPVVAVNSLHALAQSYVTATNASSPLSRSSAASASFDAAILAISDARLHEVYYAGWELAGDTWRESLPTALARPAEIAVPSAGQWIGCGSGFGVYRDTLCARLGPRLASIADVTHPDAGAVLAIAAAALRRGEGVAPEHALPIYVRDKVALTSAERAAKVAAQ